ncbi:ABC transporter permease, partial [Mycolicibacterium fortuitum]
MLSTQAATPHHAAPVHEPPAALRAAGIVIALTAAIAIVAIAFALPASRSKPHDVPVGVAGPQAATSQIAERLEQQAPGAFSVTYY